MNRLTLAELGAATGKSRSVLHRLAHRAKVVKKEPRETKGGVMDVITVPRSWANKIIRRYAGARRKSRAQVA